MQALMHGTHARTQGTHGFMPLHASDVLTANLRSRILNVRGFDSSRVLMPRGGIPRSIWDFPEIMIQRILAGVYTYIYIYIYIHIICMNIYTYIYIYMN